MSDEHYGWTLVTLGSAGWSRPRALARNRKERRVRFLASNPARYKGMQTSKLVMLSVKLKGANIISHLIYLY